MILATLSAVITFIFLLVVVSYYVLIFLKVKRPKRVQRFSSITIIVPAHNEEPYIEATLQAVLSATFKGRKQVIVVDDGSSDNTATLAKQFPVTLLRAKHSGKSASINKALKKASGEVIAIVDADSVIHKDALVEITKELGRKGCAACSCVVRVKNRKYVNIWTQIEQLYNSLMRSILGKLNANVVTPGPLSVYRSDALKEIGGFSTEGFSEDVDVTIRLIRKGYKIGFAEKAFSDTNLPYTWKDFFRQRTRFARGMLNVFKRHLRFNNALIDMYTLPILVFTYVQAIIIGSFTLYQLSTGYYTYFFSEGVYISWGVARFFFEWFSLVGFIKWFWHVLTGVVPLSFATGVGIVSTLLSYPLYVMAILKFDKFDVKNVFALFFMFPFWLLIMVIYIACIPEMFRKRQYNIWKKNE